MIGNIAGMAGSNYLDLKLDQFGLTRAPGEGKANFNLCGILNYASQMTTASMTSRFTARRSSTPR